MPISQKSAAEKVASFEKSIASSKMELADIDEKISVVMLPACENDKKALAELDRLNSRQASLNQIIAKTEELLIPAKAEIEIELQASKRVKRVKDNVNTIASQKARIRALNATLAKQAIETAQKMNTILAELNAAGVDTTVELDGGLNQYGNRTTVKKDISDFISPDNLEHRIKTAAARANVEVILDPESMEQDLESRAWSDATIVADIALGHRDTHDKIFLMRSLSLPIGVEIGDKITDMDLLESIKFENEIDRDRVAYLLATGSTFNWRNVTDPIVEAAE